MGYGESRRLPRGVNVPRPALRDNIHRFILGDTITWRERLMVGNTPVTPYTHHLLFVLADQRFSAVPILELGWGDHVQPEATDPGLCTITLPQDTANTLRRGSYIFSLAATNLSTGKVSTVCSGHLLIEYKPTSPHRHIPYHTTTHQVPGTDLAPHTPPEPDESTPEGSAD